MTEPILVRRLELTDLLVHEHTRLDLPECGIVLVTGPNGSGKSSLIEAVAVALWGKTLRGTPPWVEGAKLSGASVVLASGLTVERSKARGKVEVDFYPEGGKDWTRPIYETTTKAQAALESRVGFFDLWRRGHVFSSSDAAHFSLATDGERKRLLETMLGIDVFDDALEACRADLKAAVSRLEAAGRAVEVTRATLGVERQRLADAEAALAGAHESEAAAQRARSPGGTESLDRGISGLEADIRAARGRLRAADRAGAEEAATARQCDQALGRLSADLCPTCEQPVPEAHRARLRSRADEARAQARTAREAAATACVGVEAEIADLEEELAALRTQRERLEQAIAQERAAEAVRRAQAKKLVEARRTAEQARQRVGDLEARFTADVASRDALDREVASLRTVEAVLGLRGVRANILARALSGLEAVANTWLSRLGLPGLQARLRPYSEKKSGGVTDAISIEVSGAGGGYGYRASSGGERRRIDLALMLAIAEVAAAAATRSIGTLFFDELFDHLDAAGVAAVSDALEELARDRCVVVITHSETLARAVRPVRRVELADGLVITDGDVEGARALDAVYRLRGP